MKTLAFVLLSGIALSAFANGTWHGAYIGKGTVTNSCDEKLESGKKAASSREFVSTIYWGGFDWGTYFYYGLRFAEDVRIVANDVVLSSSWKAVFGGSGLISGEHTSYEDCPGRDACEGQCCSVEDSDDSAARQNPATSDITLGVVKNDNEGGSKRYPTKTDVRLEFKNSEKAYLSWIEAEKYQADINLEGKIILADGCELTWKDKLVWLEKKPEEIKETLECIGGRCRWKIPE